TSTRGVCGLIVLELALDRKLGQSLCDAIANLNGLNLSLTAGGNIFCDGLFNPLSIVLITEVAQQHRCGQNGCGRIRNALPSDIRRGTVHWLEHRRVSAGGVNIARGCQTDATGYSASQVSQNIAEEIIGDNHVIARWVSDHVDGCRIDVVVVDFNLGKFWRNLINGALPQVTSVDQH